MARLPLTPTQITELVANVAVGNDSNQVILV